MKRGKKRLSDDERRRANPKPPPSAKLFFLLRKTLGVFVSASFALFARFSPDFLPRFFCLGASDDGTFCTANVSRGLDLVLTFLGGDADFFSSRGARPGVSYLFQVINMRFCRHRGINCRHSGCQRGKGVAFNQRMDPSMRLSSRLRKCYKKIICLISN